MFITFEGIEGSGKSTALAEVARRLRQDGYMVRETREPGGCSLGREIRRILLNPATGEISPEAELFLYLADRAEHVAGHIRPALYKGELVLCDRYVDSTLAYQGFGRGLDLEKLRRLNNDATNSLAPHLTVLFDLEPETGLRRARSRNRAQQTEAEGRFEAEDMAFHQAVRQGYQELARQDPARWRVVDATLEQGTLAVVVYAKIREALLNFQMADSSRIH